jgi:hypothetical protein
MLTWTRKRKQLFGIYICCLQTLLLNNENFHLIIILKKIKINRSKKKISLPPRRVHLGPD